MEKLGKPELVLHMRVRHREIYGSMEEMMREEYGTWGNEGEGREERGKACDQEVEAVKISIGLGLCKHRIRAMQGYAEHR